MPLSSAQVKAAHEKGTARWPKVKLSLSAFEARLVAQAPQGQQGLSKFHAEDFYLVAACLEGNRAALAALETEVLGSLQAALVRQTGSPGRADELLQAVRERILVPDRQGVVRLAHFSGKGSLAHWLRAVASRLWVDQKRQERPTVALDEDLAADLPISRSDPELSLLRQEYRKHFKAAFTQALRELTPAQRNVLRLHVVEGLSFEKLGQLHGVHRSTALRWVNAAQVQLLDRVRALLSETLGLRRSQLDSLMRVATSQLEVSLSPLLSSKSR
jgi:RNA polymerase sigma-70 factor, ECF subfamily